MEPYHDLIRTISLAMGVAWASGINLYAAVLVLGLLGATGNITLPENLMVVQNPLVIGAAGIMYVVEFFADKVPGVDTGWDTVHTFIRIPAGAMLAAGAVGDVNPAVAAAAGLLGGGMAAGSHATKAGSRVLINTSPEPFTNWTASVVEDAAVVGGLWAALRYPWQFLLFLIVFVLLLIWLLPKLWRGVKKVFGFIGRLLGFGGKQSPAVPEALPAATEASDGSQTDLASKMAALKEMMEKGLISEAEYNTKKQQLLDAF